MTPPDESRLFEGEGVCCLCGERRSTTAYGGHSEVADCRTCEPCDNKWVTGLVGPNEDGPLKKELLRRKSQSRPAQTPAEFKVGDWFEGLTSARSRLGPDVQVRGTFVCESPRTPDCVFLDCPDVPRNLRTDVERERHVSVSRASLRPSATPASEKTAPASTGSVDAAHRETADATPEGEASTDSTQPPESGQPKDPYAAHRQFWGEADVTDLQNARDAAYLSSHARSGLLRELDRKPAEAASTHPKQWPEGSGEELYSTSGSSGR